MSTTKTIAIRPALIALSPRKIIRNIPSIPKQLTIVSSAANCTSSLAENRYDSKASPANDAAQINNVR
jgi:hypothetical protein